MLALMVERRAVTSLPPIQAMETREMTRKVVHQESGAASGFFAEEETEKDGDLHGEGDHASAGAGEEDGSAHEGGGGSGDPAFLGRGRNG